MKLADGDSYTGVVPDGNLDKVGVPLTSMRRFVLERDEDLTGVSGTGVVADGVEFEDGVCALHWRGRLTSTAVYENMATLVSIHGHEGATRIHILED